ncbi:hypothetical protein COCSUDRAFT_61812 [Coccomyxa subellipsoidea C-169]|uniref:HNH nuclease domain-containing protein n=1 Tax=Coccomyxa subellipsoidea (strain C-169) TaxID=574566 RepID=I0Z168_COCSC|nr:hypothetical protein COCSUDRAFT_61812 [Coccomyxa subellipsoidea C-169]EIE24387.1 hypothetical protein COCSUDRAFT_61812 [Coccomyxa subellipsoidea C-169]|eukprot:XP_005648931.1 hypothetical protein COCSUDRAFT_61812 [Coccomyxa subellipsoidea C-169]
MQASLGAGLVQCHMPDAPVPRGHAFAAHIFPHRCAPHMQGWISMDNVDDVANGLLFIKPLKRAMDAGRIYFSYDKREETFVRLSKSCRLNVSSRLS